MPYVIQKNNKLHLIRAEYCNSARLRCGSEVRGNYTTEDVTEENANMVCAGCLQAAPDNVSRTVRALQEQALNTVHKQ